MLHEEEQENVQQQQQQQPQSELQSQSKIIIIARMLMITIVIETTIEELVNQLKTFVGKDSTKLYFNIHTEARHISAPHGH